MQKDKRIKKIGNIVIIILLLSFYYIYLYKVFCEYPFNSDDAVQIMEGYDILHGNLFLSGWNLTTVSFIYSDLLLYVFAVIFNGVSPQSVIMVGSLVIFLMTFVFSLFIIKKDDMKENFWGLFILFAFSAFSRGHAFRARYHTASILEALLAFLLVNKSTERDKSIKKILYVIIAVLIFALSAQSDPISIIVVSGPIFLASAWKIAYDYIKTGKVSKKFIIHSAVSFSGIILSFVTDKIFYAIGGAKINHVLGSKEFISLDMLGDKLFLYSQCVLGIFNADFSGKQLLSFDTVFYFIRVMFILITMVFVIYNIVRWILQKKCDYISVILSLGVFLISFAFIFTNISENIYSSRYLGTFPAIFAVIFIRTFRSFEIEYDKLHGLSGIKIVLLIILTSLSMKTILPLPSGEMAIPEKQKVLANTLETYDLKNGYASFWNASSTTVLTNNKIHVRAVIGSDSKVSMYSWGCKTEWYKVPANFIVVSDNDEFGITYDNMISVLGEPENVIEASDFQILVYDFDISSCLSGVDPAFADGTLTGNEWYGDDTSYLTKDGARVIKPNGIIWGPYDELGTGNYMVSCEGENLKDIEVDVFSLTCGMILSSERIGEDYQIRFNLDEDVSDLEIRVYNATGKDVKINKFKIESIE